MIEPYGSRFGDPLRAYNAVFVAAKQGSGMRLLSLVALFTTLLAACARPDPENQIREFLNEAVAAVEARDTGFFRDHIADAYADAEGRSRDDLIGLLRGYFFVNREIDVFERVDSIDLDGDDFAVVVLQAAIVGNRGGGLLDVDADLETIELELLRDGSRWQVIRASRER